MAEPIQSEDPDQILVEQLHPKLDEIWELATDSWYRERKRPGHKFHTTVRQTIKANQLLDLD